MMFDTISGGEIEGAAAEERVRQDVGIVGPMVFDTVSIGKIEGASAEEQDRQIFGIIGLRPDCTVDIYNATESRLAGLSMERVVGKHFFTAVAPCMNNYMVAQRFDEEPALDATIDYVLTLRMRPTPVKLRLLQVPGIERRYILVHRP